MSSRLERVDSRDRGEKRVNSTPMSTPTIENIVLDEANQRRYIVLASRVLSDGEIYRAIRQEILRRGGKTSGPRRDTYRHRYAAQEQWLPP